ncbi:resolvase [Vibrio parahaemolyticus]|uniref:recombinase family protein n=1 Tax=Vibrio parahaemolyticus TaxID=670 RepID=UPI001DFCAA57|nr:recombinase family protein [Vibrio parahaemolyticus]EGQ9760159.1 resolvase [Vibrio parahaemolyticus]EGQ9818668.1 resolvase [Vibrio parahaemolyticus]EJL6383329.1 recombinase family protein [Vibrio parahaemolyticus]MCR9834288.1 recombinase family protein [Vibrio parahaemolyticus]
MTKYHYIRVSTAEQHTERQEVKTPEGYVQVIDKVSGRSTKRPELTNMLVNLSVGDEVLVDDISRLARSLKDLNELLHQITSKGVTVTFAKENLTFTGDKSNPTNELLLNLIGAVYQFEVDIKKERQREGIEIAKAKGVYKGRSTSMRQKSEVIALLNDGVPQRKIAEQIGISLSSVQRIVKKHKEEAA